MKQTIQFMRGKLFINNYWAVQIKFVAHIAATVSEYGKLFVALYPLSAGCGGKGYCYPATQCRRGSEQQLQPIVSRVKVSCRLKCPALCTTLQYGLQCAPIHLVWGWNTVGHLTRPRRRPANDLFQTKLQIRAQFIRVPHPRSSRRQRVGNIRRAQLTSTALGSIACILSATGQTSCRQQHLIG